MAMVREELQDLISSLLEGTDGSRADDYAVLVSEMNELYDNVDKETARAEALEIKNGELKKENFKLFSRVGVAKPEEVTPEPSEPEEPVNYLGSLLDEKGRWK